MEGSAIDVSVCIVNWNCREMLRDLLESLLRQPQGVRVEVIVVDNASTDGAADAVAAEFPEIVLVRNSVNVGFSRANNQAARLARGRYLFFLNNDTLVPPHSLRRLLNYAEIHPEIGLLGPRLRDGWGEVQMSFRSRPAVAPLLHRTLLLRWTGLFRRSYQRFRGRIGDFSGTRSVDVLLGAALFLRRSVYDECGGWDEDYVFGGEDVEFCTRIGRRYAVKYFPEVEITHFGRVSSRQHVGFAHVNTVLGIARSLRKTGTGRMGLLVYKSALTLDAPLQWLRHAGQYVWRRLRGRKAKAEKSLLVLRGVNHFLTRGLVPLWKV
jgi:GT2 family glycosyltransferase